MLLVKWTIHELKSLSLKGKKQTFSQKIKALEQLFRMLNGVFVIIQTYKMNAFASGKLVAPVVKILLWLAKNQSFGLVSQSFSMKLRALQLF